MLALIAFQLALGELELLDEAGALCLEALAVVAEELILQLQGLVPFEHLFVGRFLLQKLGRLRFELL